MGQFEKFCELARLLLFYISFGLRVMENYWLLLLCIGFVSGSSLSAHYSHHPYYTNDYHETRLQHILSGFEERIKDLEIYLDRYPYLESIIKIKTPEEWTDALNSILTDSDDAAGVTYVTDKDLYISIITPENNHPPLLLDPEGQYFDFVSNHILMDRYLKKAQELVSNNDPQVRQKLTIYILELAGQIDVTLDQNKYAYYLNVISNEAVNPRGGQSAVVEEFNKELPTISASQDADAARAIRAFFSVLADLNFLFTGDGKTLGKIMDQYKHSGPEFIIRGDLPFNKLKPAGSQFQLLEKN